MTWAIAGLVYAAAYAALDCGAYVPASGERVTVVLCGANTDPGSLT